MRIATCAAALLICACTPDGQAGEQAVTDVPSDDIAPASEAQLPLAEAEMVRTLVGDYFRRFDADEDAEALFPPGGAPAMLDEHAPVTLLEHEVGETVLEGGAGSVYATVPVRLVFTEDATGEEYLLEGDLVLRRANGVPGATEDQLRWQFHRFTPAEE